MAAALKPRNFGISDAERYQLELAVRSQAHYEAQVKAATAARARVDAVTRPSQNEQQQSQQAEHARAGLAKCGGPFSGRRRSPATRARCCPAASSVPSSPCNSRRWPGPGTKIQAIKLLRQATHTDLLTAKNYVDRL